MLRPKLQHGNVTGYHVLDQSLALASQLSFAHLLTFSHPLVAINFIPCHMHDAHIHIRTAMVEIFGLITHSHIGGKHYRKALYYKEEEKWNRHGHRHY